MQPATLLRLFINDQPVEPHIIGSRCLRRRLKDCDCSECINACPREALFFSNGEIQLNSSLCSNCLLCVSVCPNEAIALSDGLIDAMITSVSRDHLVISCKLHEQCHDKEMLIPCLAMFSWQSLVYLLTADFKEVRFATHKCDNCQNSDAVQTFFDNISLVKTICSRYISASILTQTGYSGVPEQKDNSRRSYLNGITDSIISSYKTSRYPKQENTQENGASTRYIPLDTRLIKQAVTRIKKDNRSDFIGRVTPALDVDVSCTLCPRCTGICPTGALQVRKCGDRKQLFYDRLACNGCGLCVLFCKENVLQLKQATIQESISPHAPAAR